MLKSEAACEKNPARRNAVAIVSTHECGIQLVEHPPSSNYLTSSDY